MCGEVGEGEREVMRIKRDRHGSQRHCRELIAQIEVSWKILSLHVSTHELETEGLQHSREHTSNRGTSGTQEIVHYHRRLGLGIKLYARTAFKKSCPNRGVLVIFRGVAREGFNSSVL